MNTLNSTAVSRAALVARIAANDLAMTDLQAEIDRSYSMLGCTGMHQWHYERLDGWHTDGLNLRDELCELDAAAAATPAMVPQQAQLQQADASRPTGATCEACGRTLTDPFSVKAGVGPVCRAAGHQGRRQLNLDDFLAGADFESEIVDGVITLTDLDRGGPTVTNAVIAVVGDLVYQGFAGDSMPIIYRDTSGRWDEIIVRNRAFVAFAPIGVQHRCEALAVIAKRQAAPRPTTVISAQDFMAGGADELNEFANSGLGL